MFIFDTIDTNDVEIPRRLSGMDIEMMKDQNGRKKRKRKIEQRNWENNTWSFYNTTPSWSFFKRPKPNEMNLGIIVRSF